LCNPSLEPPLFEIASGYNLLSRQQSTTSALAEENWAIGLNDLQKYEAIFNSLGPVDGRLSGNQCRPVLLNSQLPKGILAKVQVYAVIFLIFHNIKIWDLADIDADGFLDKPEFCVALHLVYRSLQNDPMPERLPLALVPPEKRMLSRQMCPRSDDLPSTHPPRMLKIYLKINFKPWIILLSLD